MGLTRRALTSPSCFICRGRAERNREVSFWAVFAAQDEQLAIDLRDKGLDDFHPETFAVFKLEFRWHSWAVVCNRYQVTARQRRFESNDDFTLAVFC